MWINLLLSNEDMGTIEIVNNRVFIDGKETVNPELIGYAVLDYAESMEKDGLKIVLKDQDVFVEPIVSEL